MNIKYTNKFVRMLNELHDEIQKKVIEKVVVFKGNPFEKSLKTHKLKGKFKECYSFSVGYSYRIVFRFLKPKNDVLFLLVGNHSIYE